MSEILKIYHDAGFFSCCTIRLRKIIEFYTQKNQLPIVDSSYQWSRYKDSNRDITQEFFKNLDEIILKKNAEVFSYAEEEEQFSDYSKLNFEFINDFVEKYFSPSDKVLEIYRELIEKNSINLNDTLSVLHRGNEKQGETLIPSYEQVSQKIDLVLSENKNIRLFLQSDEVEFYDFMLKKYPTALTIDGTLKMNRTAEIEIQSQLIKGKKEYQAQLFLAILLIISKSKHVILNSGNIGLWICLYRQSVENVHQFLTNRYLTHQ